MLYKLLLYISKLYKFDFVRRVKNKTKPVRHFLFGRQGIYKALQNLKQVYKEEVLVVFDVGAARGDTATTFLKEFPKSTVYCFEPLESSRIKLVDAVKSYGNRVKIFDFGFLSEEGEKLFHISDDASSVISGGGYPFKETRMANFQTIDVFVRSQNIPKVHLLKLDVEGAEKEALEGGLKTLRDKVDNIFIEISFSRKGKLNADYIEVFRMLNDAGFYLVNNYEHENFYFRKLN